MKYSDNFSHQHANGRSTWYVEWYKKYRYKVFNKEYHKNICMIALEEAKEYAKNQKAHRIKIQSSFNTGILILSEAKSQPAG